MFHIVYIYIYIYISFDYSFLLVHATCDIEPVVFASTVFSFISQGIVM